MIIEAGLALSEGSTITISLAVLLVTAVAGLVAEKVSTHYRIKEVKTAQDQDRARIDAIEKRECPCQRSHSPSASGMWPHPKTRVNE